MAKVLIVDDNPANRELAATLLRYHGHVTLQAGDGAQGLAMLRDQGADLVISDILMPTMDGYEFVQAIRGDPRLAHTKVIFCTAVYREHEAKSLAMRCGVSRILVKPFEAEELTEAVTQTLESEQPTATKLASEFADEHRRLLTGKVSEQSRALQGALGRLAALHDLNLRLSSERDMQALLTDVCRGARELIGARYAVVAVRDKLDPKGQGFALSGIAEPLAQALEYPPLDRGLCGTVMNERRTHRALNPAGDAAAVGLPSNYPPLHAVLVAPIVSLTHAYGWLCLADKLGESEFSQEDERVLGILAAQVGRIYENASLYGEVQRHARALEVQIAERNRAVDEQRESELRFRQLAETIQDAFWIRTADYRKVLYLSPAYEQIWGRTREDTYANPLIWARAVHPDDRAMVNGELMKRAGDPAPFNLEYRIVRPDGMVRWVSDRAFPVRDAHGRTYRVAGVVRDITQAKEQDDTIRRLTKLYAVLSGVNAMIMRIRNRVSLFQEVCRVAVTEGEFAFAWVGVIDPVTHDGRAVAWYGIPQEFISRLQLSARPDTPGAARPASTAVRTGAPVVINDVASSEQLPGQREQLLAQNYRSVAAIPIMSGKQAVAVFGFGAHRAHFFDAAVLGLLNDLARDVAFGLEYTAKEEQLAYVAVYDVLTGLPNHTLFMDRLAQALRSSAAAGKIAAVMLLDLDGFKQINDTLGRHVGDALLCRFAERLGTALPGAACVSRVSADSFAVAVGELPRGEDAAARLLERLQSGTRDQFVIDGHRIAITFRAGIAVAPTDGEDANTLFKHAEAALKRAQSSNDPVLFYSPEFNATVVERVSLEARMRRALERHEFVLHYQPKIDTETRQIVGLEALLRWNDPEHGLIMPAQIIPMLEQSGLIVPVGRAMIELALDDVRRLRALNLAPKHIAVNVSAGQLRQQGFADSVEQLIARSGIPAQALELEITESMLMEDVESSAKTLRRLSDGGVRIAIDDFGTGYSSLRYLAKLPIGTVKIDRSFIASMVEDPDSMTIVSGIISLAHSLKLQVCAEGVETQAQAQVLSMLRCEFVQGYLYGKPMPMLELGPFLAHATGTVEPAQVAGG